MKVKILGLSFDNISMDELIEIIYKTIKNKEKKFIVTPNVDILIRTKEDKIFNKYVNSADILIADGMPIVWLSKLMKTPLKERVTGADLLPRLCKESRNNEVKIFLLGGEEGVPAKAKNRLEKLYENCNIVGYYSPPFGKFSDNENQRIIEKINKSGANVLFVAFGSPKQEEWIYKNLSKLNVNIAVGCGAAIDFAAGKVKRAPLLLQKLGLEWLYRLLKEPKRLWRRYLIKGPKFFYYVYQEIKNRKIGISKY
jgi:N-acetylglucosaminyldiphosphoundecaprenol N-acetyl-beta-D-mannosaminyltransferase